MFDNLNADLRHYSRFCYNGRPVLRVLLRILYGHPAALAVIWYRFGSAAWRTRLPLFRHVLQFVYLLGMPLVRMYSGVQIQPHTKIGPGLAIMHFGGVVITRDCTIRATCLLLTMRNQRGATIGHHFYAGTGATILGTISIADLSNRPSERLVCRAEAFRSDLAQIPASPESQFEFPLP